MGARDIKVKITSETAEKIIQKAHIKRICELHLTAYRTYLAEGASNEEAMNLASAAFLMMMCGGERFFEK